MGDLLDMKHLNSTGYNTFFNNNSNFSQSNFNYDHLVPSGLDKTTESALKICFYILATVANTLLLFVMYKDPLHRLRNSTSFFIINLAIADLLSTVAGLSMSIFELESMELLVARQKIASCLQGIGVQCSFLIVMIFAIDRYIAIGHPYFYQIFASKKYATVILILLPWCISVAILPVIYFSPAHKGERTLTNLFAGDIIALSIVTLVVHPLTHWQFHRKIKNLPAASVCNRGIIEENLKISKILTLTVLLVSACLVIFMMPYFAAYCFSLANCNTCYLNETFLQVWRYYPLLTSVRLLTNSLVYAWRLPLYRKSLWTLIKNCKCLRRHSPLTNRVHQAGTPKMAHSNFMARQDVKIDDEIPPVVIYENFEKKQQGVCSNFMERHEIPLNEKVAPSNRNNTKA